MTAANRKCCFQASPTWFLDGFRPSAVDPVPFDQFCILAYVNRKCHSWVIPGVSHMISFPESNRTRCRQGELNSYHYGDSKPWVAFLDGFQVFPWHRFRTFEAHAVQCDRFQPSRSRPEIVILTGCESFKHSYLIDPYCMSLTWSIFTISRLVIANRN